MNNQAAQTMPFQPEIFRAIARSTSDTAKTNALLNAAREIERLTAALSQTAGVAEGMVLLPRDQLEGIVERLSVGMESFVRKESDALHDLLASAPAASGGEDVGRGHGNPPEEYTDWEKRVWQRGYRAGMDGQHPSLTASNPPSAASVSERARALLAAEYERYGFDPVGAQQIREGFVNNTTAMALRALEQALTQQRGDDDGDGDPMTVLEAYAQGVTDALAGKHGAGSDPVMYQQIHRHLPNAQWTECSKATFDQYTDYHRQYGGNPPVRALYTTPQPSADAVRELVQRAIVALTTHDQHDWALSDPTLVEDLNAIRQGRTNG